MLLVIGMAASVPFLVVGAERLQAAMLFAVGAHTARTCFRVYISVGCWIWMLLIFKYTQAHTHPQMLQLTRLLSSRYIGQNTPSFHVQRLS